MRILHLCDQNWVGTASTFVKMHRRFGHESRMVTLAECREGYEEDVCLHLPFVKGTRLDMKLKGLVTRLHRNEPKWMADGALRIWRPRRASRSHWPFSATGFSREKNRFLRKTMKRYTIECASSVWLSRGSWFPK